MEQVIEQVTRAIFVGNTAPWHLIADQEKFLSEVDFHGIGPLLVYKMESLLHPTRISEHVSDALQAMARHQFIEDTLVEAELIRVVHFLDKAGVRTLVMKGSALSTSIYPRLGLRPRGDTDILIPASENIQVVKTMWQLGYLLSPVTSGDAVNSARIFSKAGPPRSTFVFDVHVELSSYKHRFSDEMQFEKLWASSIEIGSSAVRTISRHDALLLACFHRAVHFSHTGERLIWLYDVHLLIQSMETAEIDFVVSSAERLHIRSLLLDALRQSRYWFGTKVDLHRFDSGLSKEDIELSEVLLCSHKNRGIRLKTLHEVSHLGSWRDKFYYLGHRAFPPVEYMLDLYDTNRKWTLPFLYLRRFLKGLSIFLVPDGRADGRGRSKNSP